MTVDAPDPTRDHIVALILTGAPRVDAKRGTAGAWRKARCKAIIQRCHATMGDRFGFVPYTLAHFGLAELSSLTDAQLEQTYHHVVGPIGA